MTGTRTITASYTSDASGDLKDGATCSYSGSTSDSGTVSDGTVSSATLYISAIRCYSSSWYLDIYVGGVKVAETVEISDTDSTTHSITVALECFEPELLTATGTIKFVVHNNNSTTANTCNFRSGTAEITVTYTAPDPVTPTVTAPTNLKIVQNSDGTFTASWGASVGTNGSGDITYQLWLADDDIKIGSSTTGLSVTCPIETYGIAISYIVIANYSGVHAESSAVTVTFTDKLPVFVDGTQLTQIICNGVTITSLFCNGTQIF